MTEDKLSVFIALHSLTTINANIQPTPFTGYYDSIYFWFGVDLRPQCFVIQTEWWVCVWGGGFVCVCV